MINTTMIYPTLLFITEGSNLGPIVCSAECHPNCSYVWKYKKIGGSFSDIDSSQSLEIYNIVNFQWDDDDNDDEVGFVLDQQSELDFNSAISRK
jgi:hypothetical protein